MSYKYSLNYVFIYPHKNKHSQGYISLSTMLFILTFYL